jgi:phosphatidylserine/phosphatidylglycerophosphate/cardiolipin synthase-like enzyme
MRLQLRADFLLIFVFTMSCVVHTAIAREIFRSPTCAINLVTNSGLKGTDLTSTESVVSLIVDRINEAKLSVDVAIHDLNEPRITQALLDSAAHGVTVRIFVDAKMRLDQLVARSHDPEYFREIERRLVLERLVKGLDGSFGTGDDIHIQAESPIEAYLVSARTRGRFGLRPTSDLPEATFQVAGSVYRDVPIVAPGLMFGRKDGVNVFRSPSSRRFHHKFLVIDRKLTITGSYNFTISGYAGSAFDLASGRPLGHRQDMLAIQSTAVALGYSKLFDRLWGGGQVKPIITAEMDGPEMSTFDFSSDECGFPISVIFTPNRHAIEEITKRIERANQSIEFALFFLTSKPIVRSIYERGTYGNVVVRGLIERQAVSKFRGAFLDVESEEQFFFGVPAELVDQPARVSVSKAFRLMHTKTLILDPGSARSATVITGSANLSDTAFSTSYENIVILEHQDIARAFSLDLRRYMNRNEENLVGYCGPFDVNSVATDTVNEADEQGTP